MFFRSYGGFITRIGFGPLRWLVVSPIYHHWHHALEPEAIDKNFAVQLAFIDRLFGALYLPEGKIPQKYGTDTSVPDTYLGQLAVPFSRNKTTSV